MRMLKRISVAFIAIMMLMLDSSAQNPTHGKLLDLIPPSPSAAALGKFGDIPVSYATGIPNISIPIYAYADKGTGLNVDISLSYHAGGARVEEHASNVGLGWALNAGGVITREVRGLPDERGYWAQDSFPSYIPEVIQTSVGVDASLAFAQYYLGLADTEPDVFTFNLSGKTGKFVIGKNGQVFLFPKQNVRIQKATSFGLKLSFTVIDDNGVKYLFDQQESTQMKAGDGTLYDAGSAWYVSKMVAPFNEDSVVFKYVDIDAWYKVNAGQVMYKLIPGNTGDLGGPPTAGQDLRSYHGKRISQIFLPTGIKIDMQYAGINRCDVSGGDAALKNIIISDSSGVTPTTRGFRLIQNYSFSDTSDFTAASCVTVDSTVARLVLHKVIEYTGNMEKPAYQVDYNAQVALPKYASYSQDHWGFFNGANNNNSLLPYEGGTYMHTPPVSSGPDNADRSVNPDFATAGIIKKITYPTGGYTSFSFESNTVPAGTSTEGGTSYINVQKKVSLNAAVDPRSKTFTYTSPQGTSDLNTSFTFSVGSIGGANCTIVASIRNLAGDTIFASAILSPTAGWQKTVTKQLPSGQYIFRYDFDNGTTCSADLYVVAVEWISREAYVPPPGNNFEYAGGLRIQKIQDCDGIGQPVKTREYTYMQEGDSISSGVMNFKPLYNYYYAESCAGGSDGICAGHNGQYNVICNSSLYSLANTLGSPVIYSRVTEKYTGDGTRNGGKIVRTFTTNTYSESIAQYNFPYITPMLSTWSVGQLVNQKVFDSTGRLLQATSNTYNNFINPVDDSIKANFIGLKFSKTSRIYVPFGGVLATTDFYRINSYNLFTGLTQLKSTIDSVYDYSGRATVKETNYQYDSVYFSTKVITTNDSKGYKIDQRLYYPYDYSITGPLQEMVTANMITTVVGKEVWQTNGGSVYMIGGDATEYAKFGDLIKPYKLYYLNATSAVPLQTIGGFDPQKLIRDTVLFKPEIEFNYNPDGNLIEQQKRFDLKEVFLYGYYNRKYPVAKITGTDYNTAKMAITQAILDAPSTDQALRDELNKLRAIPGTMVLTYTHAPLYGITSQTDVNNRVTYYEYDGFGRLKIVKDKDSNILKTFQYNYKQ